MGLAHHARGLAARASARLCLFPPETRHRRHGVTGHHGSALPLPASAFPFHLLASASASGVPRFRGDAEPRSSNESAISKITRSCPGLTLTGRPYASTLRSCRAEDLAGFTHGRTTGPSLTRPRGQRSTEKVESLVSCLFPGTSHDSAL